jgi:hypothetical protein
MMTQERRSNFLAAAVLVGVGAGWLWFLIAFAEWVLRG